MLIRILAGERWTLKNIIFIDYSLSETSQVISQTVPDLKEKGLKFVARRV